MHRDWFNCLNLSFRKLRKAGNSTLRIIAITVRCEVAVVEVLQEREVGFPLGDCFSRRCLVAALSEPPCELCLWGQHAPKLTTSGPILYAGCSLRLCLRASQAAPR